jgi:hypothetical protein
MIGIVWESPTGEVWDLREGPARIGAAGISGLLRIPAETFVRTSAVVDGQRVTGWKANARPIIFPVDISSDSELTMLATDRAFRSSLRPDREGVLTVQAPDGRSRSIAARLSPDAEDPTLEGDPLDELGYVILADLIADQPWWLGGVVEKNFTDVAPPSYGFFGPTGAGPSFYLAPANFRGSATISNPGDVDAWPLWEVLGPATAFRFTIGGQTISGSIDVSPDQRLAIDTDPERSSIRLYEADGSYAVVPYHQLDSIRFARIPDGSDRPVEVLVSGGGSARVSFRPKYFGAY